MFPWRISKLKWWTPPQNLPVVLLFWAEQVPQSVEVKNLVEQVLADYQGKASLALSDVAQDQTLAPRLQVQAAQYSYHS